MKHTPGSHHRRRPHWLTVARDAMNERAEAAFRWLQQDFPAADSGVARYPSFRDGAR